MRGSVQSRSQRQRGSVSAPPRPRASNGAVSSSSSSSQQQHHNSGRTDRQSHPNAASIVITPPSKQRAKVQVALNIPEGPPLFSSPTTSRRTPRRYSQGLFSSHTSSTSAPTAAPPPTAAPTNPAGPPAPPPTAASPLSRLFLQGFRPPSRRDNNNNNNIINNISGSRHVPPGESSSPSGAGATSMSPNAAARAKAIEIRKHHELEMNQRLQYQQQQQQQQNNTKAKRFVATNAEILSVLEFWRTSCPSEVTLKMLAFLGPSLILQLYRTQRHIHRLLQRQISWRVLCEELYKWKLGDAIPICWKEHYRLNPCIPVDFPSIQTAIAVVGTGFSLREYKGLIKLAEAPPSIRNNLTIWLRPDQVHNLSSAINISGSRPATRVTIRTMYNSSQQQQQPQAPPQPRFPWEQDTNSNLMAAPPECHPDSMDAGDRDHDSDSSGGSFDDYDDYDSDEEERDQSKQRKTPTRAIVSSQTRHRNEPLFRVTRGQLVLIDVDLKHGCSGVDIWNGNAAIHIQPMFLHPNHSNNNSFAIPTGNASASLERCWVRSLSGRGVVTVDGGHFSALHSCIRDCAGTGVYVGGRGTSATLRYTDVWSNGTGNLDSAGGISRGHSGIYMEQAKRVELTYTTVAYNTASGISVASSTIGHVVGPQQQQHNTHGLVLSHSAVLSNGCNAIDWPQEAGLGGEQQLVQPAAAAAASNNNENLIASVGVPKPQSILLQEEMIKLKMEQQRKLNHIRRRRKQQKRRKNRPTTKLQNRPFRNSS